MKTKLTFILVFIFSLFSPIWAQTDTDRYWIKEDFSSFQPTSSYSNDNYPTYPNNIEIGTKQANVEESSHCAAANIPEGNQMRIRGLFYDGYLTFTVPNASVVKIYASGKSDLLDRTVQIYRNGELVQTYEAIDRTICCKFVDKVNSNETLTYKISAGSVDDTNPIVVYYIEVLKYGQENPDASTYWIKEDFSQFSVEENYNESKAYQSSPNNVEMSTTWANVELNDDCARANSGYGNQMRIRGLSGNGAIQFTTPDAGIVRIHVSGKSSLEDRTVKIFRNNQLVKTYENLDQNVCRMFEDSIFSQNPVTYKITAGNEFSINPVVVYYVEVEKYYTPSAPGTDFSSYWIYENFTSRPVETGYTSNQYESFPREIPVRYQFANIEWGEGCTTKDNIVRISSRVGEEGYLEFTVPNYQKISIGLTGKSTAGDREILIYKNGALAETVTGLDRNNCKEFNLTDASMQETTIKIIGGNNAGSPAALNYIHVSSYGSEQSVETPKVQPISIFPNPVSDVIYFHSNSSNPAQKAWIMDLSGRQILSASNVSEINVSFLPVGIYLLKLQTEDGIFTHKLIKK